MLATDEEIVKKIQNGEKQLYAEILKRYEKKIYYYLKRLTSWDELSIEDMTQETFLKAYVNLQSFDTGRRFSSWIYRIAHNAGVDFLKSQRGKIVDIEGLEEVLPNGQKLVEEIAIEKDDKERLAKSMAEIGMKYREVLVLYYMEERSYEEISDILRIPVSTVGVLIMRAKKKLKEVYEKK